MINKPKRLCFILKEPNAPNSLVSPRVQGRRPKPVLPPTHILRLKPALDESVYIRVSLQAVCKREKK